MTARPLLERLPCISAIQVSFVGMPKYSFDLRVYGGNVRMLPGVQAYLNQLVRDSLRCFSCPCARRPDLGLYTCGPVRT